ncbi:Dolichyl-phosphate-mannose-protein mannosyltransferase [Tautonia plasticadhaerens]|uniref:Dolichyl-phosphate-mannose-protein mannosyltransferase n=1 Tax=Tautonia plasticadhaerens TaxID=2527974 RepID=A0A518HDN0_9BACT|nr:glycosyltransferase family 39 protein [Tautonia plasticadhaerens]QDV38965.1 Dolichyl-phosphate-mannose-protein mannosyltransferase [Tautonia plasticadhaerens]
MSSGTRSGPPGSRLLAPALIVGLGVALAAFVASRRGNLAWDDADYLQRGLRLARLARELGPPALAELLREGPKPPMLVAWIELAALLAGRHRPTTVIVLSSVLPFVLLMLAVAGLARRLHGPRAAPVALLVLAASPLALSYGAKVMVETFMALWVLLAFAGAALVLDRPTRGRALLLGAALGAAAMTKMTVALLLPAPGLYFAVALARRDFPRSAKARAWAWILAPCLAIAGPWYAENAGDAVRFSARAARYNLLAEGRADSTPIDHRLSLLAGDLAGWAVLAGMAVVVAAAAAVRARRGGPDGEGSGRPGPSPPAASELSRITLLGLAGGGAVLLFTPHFDPRFLLPAWPALAVCASGWLVRGIAPAPRALGGLVVASLLLGVGISGMRLLREPRTTTCWEVGALIDELVDRHGARRIGQVGDSPGWNVCKTGLVNELRDDPADCDVSHNLSRLSPEELARLAPRFDALIVLSPDAFPPGLLASAPGLNRALDAAADALPPDRFLRVEPASAAAAGLPPMSIYVRRPDLPGPRGSTSGRVRPASPEVLPEDDPVPVGRDDGELAHPPGPVADRVPDRRPPGPVLLEQPFGVVDREVQEPGVVDARRVRHRPGLGAVAEPQPAGPPAQE